VSASFALNSPHFQHQRSGIQKGREVAYSNLLEKANDRMISGNLRLPTVDGPRAEARSDNKS
jgi:hypothetical protein